ncbi:MAG: RimK/LysX family protein [Nitriliruptorales bacterium]|nr:RimK/LysX family protein [Nitriliruptorales bacterium]
MEQRLPVLGWKEQAALPELGVERLRVKLDTGARTSALHVESVEVTGEHQVDGETLPVLRLVLLVGSRDRPRTRTVEVPAVGSKMVRDTGANAELRHVVRTRVVCGPLDIQTPVTITDRTGMNFRMLLGRAALAGRCLVDPDEGYLHSPQPPPRRSADTTADPAP